MVATYRDTDLEVSRPLEKSLRNLVRERLLTKITVRRLGQAAVAGLLEDLAGRKVPETLAHLIHSETEGNPFFVEEVYLHLAEEGRLFDESGKWRDDLSLEELEVPEGVRLVVGRRIEQLDEEALFALSTAAVIGRRFGFEALAAASQVGRERLVEVVEGAERLALVEPIPSSRPARDVGYRFSHELIRQTLLASLSLPRRQQLHLRVAEAIEASSSPGQETAPALAHHLLQAGAAADLDKTIACLE